MDRPNILFFLLDILQNLDEVLQTKNIAWIWSIISGLFIPGALVCRMSKVDHPDVNFSNTSRRVAVGCLQSLLRMLAIQGSFRQLLPIIDDEERARIEPV